jgi:putative transposase
VCRAFIGNIESTKENRKHGLKDIKYPWRDKKFYPTHWHSQAIKHQKGKTVLPMGKGRKPIVLPLEIDPNCTIVKLVWNRGYELHVSREVETSGRVKTNVTAAIDLGEIPESYCSRQLRGWTYRYGSRHPLTQAAAPQTTAPDYQKTVSL